MKSLKFLSFLVLPVSVYISFTSHGWLSYLPLFLFFGLLPILEFAFPADAENLDKENAKKEKENKVYTYILYLCIPIQCYFLYWFFEVVQEPGLALSDLIGRIIAMGLMCGVIGINVGHELGHRNNRVNEFLGEILLLSSLNTHFLPYHNGGHHLEVATPKDAATARKNEWLYIFWFRSHFTSYAKAWKLENQRLKNSNRPWFHYQNRMVVYSLCNLLLITGIYLIYGKIVLLAFLVAAIFGIFLLQTVNYIEHYGLLRKQDENGRYERVKRTHSWNSDHVLGKMMLFNLSRHSDHHYNGSKHYQLLNSLPESPQMPTGYPGMMLLALIPPLWFRFMNKKLQAN